MIASGGLSVDGGLSDDFQFQGAGAIGMGCDLSGHGWRVTVLLAHFNATLFG